MMNMKPFILIWGVLVFAYVCTAIYFVMMCKKKEKKFSEPKRCMLDYATKHNFQIIKNDEGKIIGIASELQDGCDEMETLKLCIEYMETHYDIDDSLVYVSKTTNRFYFCTRKKKMFSKEIDVYNKYQTSEQSVKEYLSNYDVIQISPMCVRW